MNKDFIKLVVACGNKLQEKMRVLKMMPRKGYCKIHQCEISRNMEPASPNSDDVFDLCMQEMHCFVDAYRYDFCDENSQENWYAVPTLEQLFEMLKKDNVPLELYCKDKYQILIESQGWEVK